MRPCSRNEKHNTIYRQSRVVMCDEMENRIFQRLRFSPPSFERGNAGLSDHFPVALSRWLAFVLPRRTERARDALLFLPPLLLCLRRGARRRMICCAKILVFQSLGIFLGLQKGKREIKPINLIGTLPNFLFAWSQNLFVFWINISPQKGHPTASPKFAAKISRREFSLNFH